MSHDRPPQLQGCATLLRKELLTPRMLRLHFHAPELASMIISKPAHAVHAWFGPRTDASDKTNRRVFTLRKFDAASATLAIDVFLHDGGLASNWALRASAGDYLEMAGPRSGLTWPAGADWLLTMADESAMPAVASIIERTPASQPSFIFLCLQHSEEQGYFDVLRQNRPALRIICFREPSVFSAPSITGRLADSGIPTSPGLAFIAGETRWVQELKSALDEIRQSMPAPLDIHASGYWSRQQAAYTHG